MKISKTQLENIIKPIVEDTVKEVLTKVLLESFTEVMIKESLNKKSKVRKRRRHTSPNRDNILGDARRSRENNLKSLHMEMKDDFNDPVGNPVKDMLNEMGIEATALPDDSQNPETPPIELNELSSLGIDMDFSEHVNKMSKK